MWRQVAVALAVCGVCSALPELKLLGNYTVPQLTRYPSPVYAMAASGDKVLVGGAVRQVRGPLQGYVMLLNGSNVPSVSVVTTVTFWQGEGVHSIRIEGDYAYVVCTDPGTYLYRVGVKEQLTEPVMLWFSNSTPSDSAGSVTVCGPYLCVRTDTVTFLMPNGTVVRTLDAPRSVVAMAVSGDTLFVVIEQALRTVQAVHLAPPFRMKFFKMCTDDVARDYAEHTLTVVGDLLYINSLSLVIVNITSGETLSTVTNFFPCTSLSNLVVHNDFATMCGSYLVNVANRRAPFPQYKPHYSSSLYSVVCGNLWSVRWDEERSNLWSMQFSTVPYVIDFYAYPPTPPLSLLTPAPTPTPQPTPGCA